MKLNKKTVLELNIILKRNYGLELSHSDLEKFAHSLVGYMDALIHIERRRKFENRPKSLIDSNLEKVEDKRK